MVPKAGIVLEEAQCVEIEELMRGRVGLPVLPSSLSSIHSWSSVYFFSCTMHT